MFSEAIFIFLILNFFFDIRHVCYTMFILLFGGIKKRIVTTRLLDETTLTGICLTTDLDMFFHMNNSRYLRDADIGRIKFWTETGIWNIMKKLGCSMTAGGHIVRYRKSISLFTRYRIKTKVIYWDSSAFYVEQSFVRNSDGFICCLILVKQTVIGVRPEQIVDKLGYPVSKPEVLPEVTKWIESTVLSSDRLKRS